RRRRQRLPEDLPPPLFPGSVISPANRRTALSQVQCQAGSRFFNASGAAVLWACGGSNGSSLQVAGPPEIPPPAGHPPITKVFALWEGRAALKTCWLVRHSHRPRFAGEFAKVPVRASPGRSAGGA